ncbi:MAG TPA: hypothetical protein VHE35_00880 [Kofleriaceae bacterium]|nr:hypothetical protein [Kofleriaceae bacterium]
MITDLTEADLPLLDQVIGLHLKGLLAEIADADDRAYREELRKRHEQLDDLRHRLRRRA